MTPATEPRRAFRNVLLALALMLPLWTVAIYLWVSGR